MNKINYGIIGILSVLVATLGGTIYLNPDQLAHGYICTTNQQIVIADNLSSTFKTAYWQENGIVKSKICTNGIWRNLNDYLKENNLTVNLLINKEEPKAYSCGQNNCTIIQ